MSDDSFSSEELSDVLSQDTSEEDASLSDTIAAAVKASEEDETPSETPSEADKETDVEDEPEETPEGDDSEETKKTADSEESGDDKTDQTKEGDDDPAAQSAIDPPARFSETDKETFRSLPREAQEILAARNQEMEADYTRKTTEIAEQRKAAETFSAVVEPYQAYLASMNTTPERAFQVLISADYQLRNGTPEQKVKIAAQLVRDYGIDLTELSELSEDEQVSPEMAQLTQRQQNLERYVQGQQAQVTAQVQNDAEAYIKTFAEEKDASGNLLHPHLDKIRAVMGSLIDANPEWDMQTAYENAVWGNPALREENLATQRKDAEEAAESKRAEAAKKAETERGVKAKKAKKAASSVKGGAEPSGLGTEPDLSLRDQIKKEFEQRSSSP